MAADQVEQGRRCTGRKPLGAPFRPRADAFGKEPGTGLRIERDVTEDSVGSVRASPRVLHKDVGPADHVIVEEQDDVIRGFGRAAVARGGEALVPLDDDLDRERAVDLAKRGFAAVGRPVAVRLKAPLIQGV
jgi:hypothetical protein